MARNSSLSSSSAGAIDGSWASRAAAERAELFAGADVQYALEDLALLADEIGIEQRHPYLDERLVRWALSVPDEFRWRDGDDRWFARELARRHLPVYVTAARSKPAYDSLCAQEIAVWHRDEPDALRAAVAALSERGWVVPSSPRG